MPSHGLLAPGSAGGFFIADSRTPPVGFEPTTDRLEGDCYYPAELRGLITGLP